MFVTVVAVELVDLSWLINIWVFNCLALISAKQLNTQMLINHDHKYSTDLALVGIPALGEYSEFSF